MQLKKRISDVWGDINISKLEHAFLKWYFLEENIYFSIQACFVFLVIPLRERSGKKLNPSKNKVTYEQYPECCQIKYLHSFQVHLKQYLIILTLKIMSC